MSLNYRATDIAYNDAVFNFVSARELARNALDLIPRDIGDHAVTIGTGLNISSGRKTNRWAVYEALGIKVDLTSASGNALTSSGTTIQQSLEKSYIGRLDAILTSKTFSVNEKVDQINLIMAERFVDTRLDGYADNRQEFFAFTDGAPQIRQSFDLAVQFYEQDLRDRFDKYAPNVYADPAFATSKEHAALLSMIWVGGPGGVSTELMSAMNSHNRAEAWFEIRYKANKLGYKVSQNGDSALSGKDLNDYGKNFDKGWAHRRYAEANLFGLYEDATQAIPTPEAKDIYRMFTKHRAEIAAYEKTYGIAFDGTLGTRDNNLGVASYEIRRALDPAKMSVLGDLGANANQDVSNAYQKWVVMPGNDPQSFNATNLYVAPDGVTWLTAKQYDTTGTELANNDIIIGNETKGSVLIGGAGNDLLIGGAGKDALYGNEGNDVMAGGAGDDTYFLVGGGQDTIEDKQGSNTIVFNDKTVRSFYNLGGMNFMSTDGWFSKNQRGQHRNTF